MDNSPSHKSLKIKEEINKTSIHYILVFRIDLRQMQLKVSLVNSSITSN